MSKDTQFKSTPKRDKSLIVPLTEGEHETVKETSKARGETMAEFTRLALLDRIQATPAA